MSLEMQPLPKRSPISITSGFLSADQLGTSAPQGRLSSFAAFMQITSKRAKTHRRFCAATRDQNASMYAYIVRLGEAYGML